MLAFDLEQQLEVKPKKKICILCQLRFERICLPDMSVLRTLVLQRSILEGTLSAISLAY